MKKGKVLYHADCWDGFGAAWAARKKLGDEYDYVAVRHGEDPPDVEGLEVYIVDFSYPREVLIKLAKQAKKITIIDHHKTAAEDLEGPIADNVAVEFDMERSGAVMTWQHFHPELTPSVLRYIQDRDLWRFEMPNSKEVTVALRSHPKTFDTLDLLESESEILRLAKEGEAIHRYMERVVEDEHLPKAQPVTLVGKTGLVVNATTQWSEIAGALAERSDFGAAWNYDKGKFIWSLRSRKDGINVSAIAKLFGGGGHEHAAGFRVGLNRHLVLLGQGLERGAA